MSQGKPAIIVLVIVMAVLVVSGCASTINLKPVEIQLESGDYQKAVTTLQSRSDELQRVQGELVLNLDLGLAHHYNRDFAQSNLHLSQAEQLIDKAYTQSVTANLASFIVNDTTKEYPGEDFEDIYSNVFKALNYQALGMTEDAMVEIRRSSEKQQVLKNKYEKMLSLTTDAALSNKVGNVQTSVVSIEFSHSALSDYLGMLFARTLGDGADKDYYYNQVGQAFASQSHLYPFAVPSSLEEELSIPQDRARLNIIAFCGLEPQKKEIVDYIPLSRNNWAKIALPVMQGRSSRIAKVQVSVGEVADFLLEPIENLGEVASNTFQLRKQSIYNKTVLRSTFKAMNTEILGITAHELSKQGDEGHTYGAIADVLTIFSSIFQHTSEQADLRMSHFFPALAMVGGVNIPEGVYDVTISFKDVFGNILGNVIYKALPITKDKLNLYEADCIR
ncbi:MAG: hypothetical protein WC159_09375 [Sphaerochaetaceae bacterium]